MSLKTKYSPLQHFSVDNVINTFSDLPPRKKMTAVGIVLFVLVVLVLVPISLLTGKLTSLKKEIAATQKGYAQVYDKIGAYQAAKAQISSLEDRFDKPSGSLTSRVEGIARQMGITVDQLREKSPQETDYFEINSVEAKFSNVNLSQLTELLFNLENDKTSPMRLRRLEVKPKYNNRQVLDVSCEVATFVLKKEV